jgi:hypothetical protein
VGLMAPDYQRDCNAGVDKDLRFGHR